MSVWKDERKGTRKIFIFGSSMTHKTPSVIQLFRLIKSHQSDFTIFPSFVLLFLHVFHLLSVSQSVTLLFHVNFLTNQKESVIHVDFCDFSCCARCSESLLCWGYMLNWLDLTPRTWCRTGSSYAWKKNKNNTDICCWT